MGIENYNLHPIVRSPKTDKCGPHEVNGKKPFQPTRLLKPWGKAPLKRDICRNREGLGPAYRGWNIDYYNCDSIVTNFKAHKGGPSKEKGKKTSPWPSHLVRTFKSKGKRHSEPFLKCDICRESKQEIRAGDLIACPNRTKNAY